jgi:hypothetical protein
MFSLDEPFEIRYTATFANCEENPGKLRYTKVKKGCLGGERRR